MRPVGIDVSKYDLWFDPAKAEVRPAFVIQRAGYGIVKDQRFEAHPLEHPNCTRAAAPYFGDDEPVH